MKQITKMSRLVSLLEKMFNMLNKDWFDNELPMPIITVIPTGGRSYAHFTPAQVWETANGGKHEINIASGSLDRPLEATVSSVLHEACHFLAFTRGIADTSRQNSYHNRFFYDIATKHGLIVEKTAKYGWSKTSCSEELFSWICDNADAFREIELCRIDPYGAVITGGKTPNGATPVTINGNSHSRKYQCPVCKASVRATKTVNIICADCMQVMVET